MIVKSMTLINKSKALIDKSKAMIWIFLDIVVTFDFVEDIFVRQYRNKKVFLFCIVLTFSYLDQVGRATFSLGNENKQGFILHFARFFVPSRQNFK